MAGINYPGSFDTFYEPASPAETPLSQSGTDNAGTYTRNHFQHHRDLGDAVEKLERGAAYRDHDHSGDTSETPDGIRRGAKLKQANTHEEADTDSSPQAIHHTLGTGPNQAARGNHTHNYTDLIGVPYLPCTSTTRPTNPAPGMMIFETDTGKMRIWAAYHGNVAVSGLSGIDNFDRTNMNNLGPSLWSQTYKWPGQDYGYLAIRDGNHAAWWPVSDRDNRCIARRTNPADAVTLTDNQVVTWKSGDKGIEIGLPPIEDWNDVLNFYERMSTNDVFLRVSADLKSYIRVKYAYTSIFVYYTTGGMTKEVGFGRISDVETGRANSEWRAEASGSQLIIHQDGKEVTRFPIPNAASWGSGYRGWAFGMQIGPKEFLGIPVGQNLPANVDWVKVQDSVMYQTDHRWTLLPVAGIPTCRLRQTQAQKLSRTGSVIEWNEATEDTGGFYSASNRRNIIIPEPGLYHIDAALQWNPQVVPDITHLVLLVNGVETGVRQDQYLRGDAFQPAFSQTVSLSGKIRVAAGDAVSLKASYVASASILDQIFSYFDQSSKVFSRLEITYLSP